MTAAWETKSKRNWKVVDNTEEDKDEQFIKFYDIFYNSLGA